MIDPHSPTWIAVRKTAEQMIEADRGALEARGLPDTDTEFHRGRISALKEVLALTTPPIVMEGGPVPS